MDIIYNNLNIYNNVIKIKFYFFINYIKDIYIIILLFYFYNKRIFLIILIINKRLKIYKSKKLNYFNTKIESYLLNNKQIVKIFKYKIINPIKKV